MTQKPALHYKKLNEINDWISKGLSTAKSSTLCLSGPSGTGKRFVLQYLSHIVGFSLQKISFPQWLLEGLYTPESNANAIGSFLQSIFLFSSSNAINFGPPDEIDDSHPIAAKAGKIFVIDDFPFHVETAIRCLFSFLGGSFFVKSQAFTIILVYTEINFKEDRMFFEYCSKANFAVIKMSPIPASYIERVLNIKFSRSNVKRNVCTKSNLIKEISHSSNGDIRMALNAFDFWCLLPSFEDLEYVADRFFRSHKTLYHILAYLFFGLNGPTGGITSDSNKWQSFVKYYHHSRRYVSSDNILAWIWENAPLFLSTDSISFLHVLLEAASDCSFVFDCFQVPFYAINNLGQPRHR